MDISLPNTLNYSLDSSMSLPDLYYCDDKLSFAYDTVRVRWVKIIDSAIRDAKVLIADESRATGFINKLQQLLVSLENNEVIQPFTDKEIELLPELYAYNHSLAILNQKKLTTWRTGPWLYLECLLYELFRLWAVQLDIDVDIFETLKNQTFQQSESGVLELCKHYSSLDFTKSVDSETLRLLFREFIDISLWGNATDLSLLAGNVTLDDIKSLQGAEVRKQNEKNILVNDIDKAWNHLQSVQSDKKRIDIVLDNSGFELFADLIFVLVVLDTRLVDNVHIHCKEIPWFVSDTMPKDFHNLMAQLVDKSFYPNIKSDEDRATVIKVHDRIKHYYDSGKLVVESDPFWTLDLNFWSIPKYEKLYQNLLQSNLVIFKGDLNYRKLTGDLQWDKTTPFTTAIQDLATSKLPILSLRTCKADVVVGLPKGVNEQLIETYKSMGNEVGEFWSSSGKWAVISFSDGKL